MISILLICASITFGWNPNTEPNLGGYKLHIGKASGIYTQTNFIPANLTNITITNLDAGKYYAALTAIEMDGLESDFSNEVQFELFDVELTLQVGETINGPWKDSIKLKQSYHNTNTAQFYRGIITIMPK